MIRLIADSGSTKTDWALFFEDSPPQRFLTTGMNPSLMSMTRLQEILIGEVLPQLQRYVSAVNGNAANFRIDNLRFYGAGCRPEQVAPVRALLQRELLIDNVEVASDLLGAAHALCGNRAGIVCILGTGSGSAIYDGKSFVQSTPSLGYILGDEGSGASLGKHLLADVLKQQLPTELCDAFEQQYQLDVATVIQHVYREPAANRYLAQFTRFLSEHLQHTAIQLFVVEEFRSFFRRNIATYRQPQLDVNFVGSVAAVFEDQLRMAAAAENFKIGKIIRSPLDEIVERGISAIPVFVE